MRFPGNKTVFYAVLFLFFFQLLSDFIAAIYAFGLMGTSLPVEIVYVFLLFSPVALLLFRRGLPRWLLLVVGELILASRVAEAALGTRGRMIVAGLGVACFLILFPSLLTSQDDRKARNLGTGLTLGLALSILFRVLGSGVDISTIGWSQAVGWVLAAWAAVAMFGLPQPDAGSNGAAGLGRSTSLSLGLTSVLLLLYFAFTSPNVIARWTGASYPLIVSLIVLLICLFAFLLKARPGLFASQSTGTVFAWNLLFVLAVVLTILGCQIKFPSDLGAYPLFEPHVTWLYRFSLLLMLFLFPVILVDFILFVRALEERKPSPRVLGASFTIASFFLLFIILAQVFTTTYDYIPVVGPFFRDKFWLVFLLAGAGLALPVLLTPAPAAALSKLDLEGVFPTLLILVAALTVGGLFLTAARPVAPSGQAHTLQILTYNIQQGYSADGLINYDGQLDLIREVDADVIGLQESDTNRVAGGNSDIVRYFADRLNLYSYYGPKTVPGTFGIALLSKYPIENPRTFYMYSAGEQTAAIEAQVRVGGRRFNLFVTHLGNGGPIVQQEEVLQVVAGQENVVLMGDFNFEPTTEQYRLTSQALDDSWLLKWPQGNADQGISPDQRIDHIFVSPGTKVVASRYLAGPQSDHPAMTTTIEW